MVGILIIFQENFQFIFNFQFICPRGMLTSHIDQSPAIYFKRSLRTLPVNVAKHRRILKNNKNMVYPRFIFHPKQERTPYKTGVSFYCVGTLFILRCIHKKQWFPEACNMSERHPVISFHRRYTVESKFNLSIWSDRVGWGRIRGRYGSGRTCSSFYRTRPMY